MLQYNVRYSHLTASILLQSQSYSLYWVHRTELADHDNWQKMYTQYSGVIANLFAAKLLCAMIAI